MASIKYSYNKTDFPNQVTNTTTLTQEINNSAITVALDYIDVNEIVGDGYVCDIWFKDTLNTENETILDGIVGDHVGSISTSVENITLTSELRDRSGKLRVHQTSRKLGLRIMWTGVGDDQSSITKIGGGESLSFAYHVGDTAPMVKYIDFNAAENETWLHEGYITWAGGDMDTLSLSMVPRTVTVSGVVGGNKTIYGGYMVIPTAPGAGNYEIVNDLTIPNNGLVYIPNNDLNEPPVAYWDADYSTSTHKYSNIRPNLTGTGRYNIFSYEVVFAQFVRQIPLLASGFIALSSSDSDQLGQGMRLKMVADTNDNTEDHDWSVACIMCLHRKKSV